MAVGALFIYAQMLPAGSFQKIDFRKMLILHVLINWPHFFASYRLLYRSKEQITEYRWASMFIPLILFQICLYAFFSPNNFRDVVNYQVIEYMTLAGIFLLAWHYTGQAWGMTASFCYIAGIRMDPWERRLIRVGYRTLLIFHLLWAAVRYRNSKELLKFVEPKVFDVIITIYLCWSVVALLTIICGIVGFVKIWRRTGRSPPLRAIVPWVAIYFWYALVFFYPGAFLLLQISHALQYLIFPIRVEVNQYVEKKHAGRSRQMIHAFLYYLLLVAVSLALYWGPGAIGGANKKNMYLQIIIVNFIQIHHYFIDGAIWKISNPRVRKDLFSHLKES